MTDTARQRPPRQPSASRHAPAPSRGARKRARRRFVGQQRLPRTPLHAPGAHPKGEPGSVHEGVLRTSYPPLTVSPNISSVRGNVCSEQRPHISCTHTMSTTTSTDRISDAGGAWRHDQCRTMRLSVTSLRGATSRSTPITCGGVAREQQPKTPPVPLQGALVTGRAFIVS